MTLDIDFLRTEASDILDMLGDLKYMIDKTGRDDLMLDRNAQGAIDSVNAIIDELDLLQQKEG